MVRKSQRLSSGTLNTPARGHKRAASNTATASGETKRTKAKKATPTKSQYFESQDDPKRSDEEDPEIEDPEESTGEEDASDFGNGGQNSSASSDSEPEEAYESESDEPKSSRKRSAPKTKTTSSAAIRTKGSELWRPGVKAGLGAGKQVVIKKPKARPAGKTPYQDETIHPNTLLFLKDLKENNERQWLKMNDAEFRQAERDWYSLVEKITEKLMEIDETIPELPVKDVIFRIYRDVRFTNDPTPYKPHFSAAWSRTGRKGPYAAYYVQISPDDQSFVGGGLWHPESSPTAAMRRDIDRHPRRIKDVLMGEGMRKEFLGGVTKEKQAVNAFVASNSENALKTKPKGFDADHVDVDLLRLRNYTIGRRLNEQEIVGKGGLDRIAYLLSCMSPFVTYLNSVVMPDEDEGDSEDESEEESPNDGSDEDEDA